MIKITFTPKPKAPLQVRNISYHFNTQNNVKAMKVAVEKLKDECFLSRYYNIERVIITEIEVFDCE